MANFEGQFITMATFASHSQLRRCLLKRVFLQLYFLGLDQAIWIWSRCSSGAKTGVLGRDEPLVEKLGSGDPLDE